MGQREIQIWLNKNPGWHSSEDIQIGLLDEDVDVCIDSVRKCCQALAKWGEAERGMSGRAFIWRGL